MIALYPTKKTLPPVTYISEKGSIARAFACAITDASHADPTQIFEHQDAVSATLEELIESLGYTFKHIENAIDEIREARERRHNVKLVD